MIVGKEFTRLCRIYVRFQGSTEGASRAMKLILQRRRRTKNPQNGKFYDRNRLMPLIHLLFRRGICLGGCPRIAIVTKARLVESEFLII